MSTDPCRDAAIHYVRRNGSNPAPGHSPHDVERLYLSVDDHYRLSAQLRKRVELLEEVAKDLADSGSAIVLNMNAGNRVPTLVLGLWMEALQAYDEIRNDEELEEVSP